MQVSNRVDFRPLSIAEQHLGPHAFLKIAGLLLCLLLAACGSRPEAGALAISLEPAPEAEKHDIMIVTTRDRDPRPDTYFNGERGAGVDFAEASISVPPSHVAGEIEWPEKLPGNPETDFVARSANYIDGKEEFLTRINQRLSKLPKGERTVFLFIHGYNTLFAEGLYRFTQFTHDAQFEGVPVYFSWASRGRVQDYVYDLNSTSIARDALENTVRQLVNSKAERIIILAHSMGNMLLMETARQLSPAERAKLGGKIENVILAAPDIDIDVFKQQLRGMGKPKKPFHVIVSRDDRALRISRAIAGGKERVGAYSNDKELAELGVVVVDLTELESLDGAHHSKFAQLAQFRPELRQVLAQKNLTTDLPRASGQGGVAGQSLGSLVTSTAQIAVTLPITLISAPVNLVTGSGQ